MAADTSPNLISDVWDYPLFDALFGRRTRRFGLGFEMDQGPYPYASSRPPLPLCELEEATLVAAGVGFSGMPLWDQSRPLPYRSADGRTFPSTSRGRRTALFFSNDNGVHVIDPDAGSGPKAVCNYIYQTYGRFPGTVDAMHLMWMMQAHHLDTDYYDRYFREGAYGPTHAAHMARWHA